MSSQLVAPVQRGHRYLHYSTLEWRRLLRLLERLEALPTASARSRWIAKLQAEDAEFAEALLLLAAARERADAAAFMTNPAIRRDALRGCVEALVQSQRDHV
jgi:thioesterase domain-containing protein